MCFFAGVGKVSWGWGWEGRNWRGWGGEERGGGGGGGGVGNQSLCQGKLHF